MAGRLRTAAWRAVLKELKLRGEAKKLCGLCLHSLEDNSHGFDQNDGYLDEEGKFIHSGRCTYCKVCWGKS